MTLQEATEKIGVCVNKPFEIRLYSNRGFDTIICERHVSTCHWNGITQYGNQEWTYTARVWKNKAEKVSKKTFSKKSEVLEHIKNTYPNLFSIAISKL